MVNVLYLYRNQHSRSLGVQANDKVVDVKVRPVTARTNVKYNGEGSHFESAVITKKKRTWSRIMSNPNTLKDNVLGSLLPIASLYA